MRAIPRDRSTADLAYRRTASTRRVFEDALAPLAEALDLDGATTERFLTGQLTSMIRVPLTEPIAVRIETIGWDDKPSSPARTMLVEAVLLCDPDHPFTWRSGTERQYFEKLYYVGTKLAGKGAALRPAKGARPGEWHEVRDAGYGTLSRRTFTPASIPLPQ